ncbi:MAG: CBS domain-containing protein [Clostridia bacterium]|nr:CBS domain-containing protein [Clostridia bacterium]
MESNAKRFIKAYNKIDHSLRVQHNFRRSMSFSDIIRRSVPMNYIARRYEDDLIDYGRLRNAIIHGQNDNYIIAEPHEEVVIKMEHIANLISTPPKAIDIISEKNVLCVENNVSVKEVIKLISGSGFSNIPIYKDSGLIGVANGQRILDKLGKILSSGQKLDDFIEKKNIEELLDAKDPSKHYEIVSKNVTIEEVLNLFYLNRKLTVVLITNGGELKETPIGIIAVSDIIEMNSILENY